MPVRELKDDVLCFYGEDSDDTDIQFEDNLEHFELIERALKENAAEVQRILANVPIVWDGQQWEEAGGLLYSVCISRSFRPYRTGGAEPAECAMGVGRLLWENPGGSV